MCASCNPKPAPEPVVAKSAPRVRATSATRAPSRPVRTTTRVPGAAAQLVSVLDQRVYHVTSIRNLEGLVREHALLASAEPVMGLSPTDARTERSTVLVDGVRGTTLDSYVPFFLSPDATLWQALRAGARHPRLSSEAIGSGSSDFVFLVTTIRALRSAERSLVLADGNPASDRTRFATTDVDVDRMIGRLRADSDGDGMADAELLVEDSLSLDAVSLLGVQNDKVRAAVRDVLAGTGFAPKVSVYPPWFQVAE